MLVKRILRKHGNAADKPEKEDATRTVLDEAVLLSADWAATRSRAGQDDTDQQVLLLRCTGVRE